MAALLQPVPQLPAGQADLQAFLTSVYETLQGLANPAAPVQLPEIETAADLLAQAPAESWPNSAIIVREHNCIAVSTNVAGTWTWRRADGSAL